MSRRGPVRRWPALAAAAVMLVAVTGCGGDEPEPGTTSPSTAATVKSYERSVAGVVEAAEVFLATLDDDQRAEVQLEFTEQNATSWSNLPCGSTCRPGIGLGELDAHQLAAAKSVLKTALGSEPATGYERVEELMLADDVLGETQSSSGGNVGPGGSVSGGPQAATSGAPSGGPSGSPSGGPSAGPASGGPGAGSGGPGGAESGYGSDLYFLAFLGEPSTTGTWQLDFGGHHLAVHLTYRAGQVISASPYFAGVEPTGWTDDAKATHAPLEDMRKAMLAMTGSLSAAQQKKARIGQTFIDVLAGPQKDGQFPDVRQGLAAGSLTAAQKKLVLAAITPWVAAADEAAAEELMKAYEAELNQTYIGWSGTTGLNRHADYVRIDGPSVWIEFVCQNGVVIENKIHYHTVYRDRTRDYGGGFSFS
ncbi:DUF3500 domain-containing protein [Actinoplanes sp. DH11]|uniref:DUF3500 domain-containing protein n=1 Tax=Actinoplanes sp. DH11 TaxID=2857011 RepID=UPI001E2AACBA|nr:DUF3500 domain-containing protein [Actinoplanes sp. DH11]